MGMVFRQLVMIYRGVGLVRLVVVGDVFVVDAAVAVFSTMIFVPSAVASGGWLSMGCNSALSEASTGRVGDCGQTICASSSFVMV